jgi:hypothetical protein
MLPQEISAHLRVLATGTLSLWFTCWAIRRRGEFDIKLTSVEQKIRWLAAVAGFALTFLPGQRFAIVRLIGGIAGMFFVAWPNLAHHLSVMLHLARPDDVLSE